MVAILCGAILAGWTLPVQCQTAPSGVSNDSPEIKAKRDRAKEIARKAFSDRRQAPNELRESIAMAEEARAMFAELGDKIDEAGMLLRSAESYVKLGENRKALELSLRAWDLVSNAGGADEKSAVMGQLGMVYTKLGEKQKALDHQLKALEIVKAAPEMSEFVPLAMFFVGRAYFDLGNTAEAFGYYDRALALIEKSNRKFGLEGAMKLLGDAYLDLGQYERALNFYQSALHIYEQKNRRAEQGFMLSHIGNAYSASGDHTNAASKYAEALDRMKGNKAGEALVLSSRGLFYMNTGDREKARQDFNVALERSREEKNDLLAALALNNLGLLESLLAEYSPAAEHFREVLILTEKTGDKQQWAVTMLNLGFLNNSLGEHDKALENYRQALAVMEMFGNRPGQAFALNNMGLAEALMGENEKALAFYKRAASLDKALEQVGLNNRAGLLLRSTDVENAIRDYAKSLELSRASGNRGSEAITLQNLGAAYHLKGDHRTAVSMYDQALELHRASGDLRNQALVLNNLMNSWSALDRPRFAILYGKQAVNILQSLRGGIRTFDADTQKSFLSTVDYAYRSLAELLIRQGRYPEAEGVIRMLKDEEYFEFVKRDGRVVASLDDRMSFTASEKAALGLIESAFADVDIVRKKIEKLAIERTIASADKRPAVLASIDEANAELNKASAAMRAAIAKTEAQLLPRIPPEATGERGTRGVIREWNDPRTAVVSTVVGPESLAVIVTTAFAQRGYVRKIPEAQLRKLVDDLRSSITKAPFEPSDPRPAAQALYNELVKPIEKDLRAANVRTVVWSLDKFLRYVPVSALWDAKQGYVVQRYASVVLALAGRQDLAFRPVNKRQWRAFGVGTSKPSGKLDALTNVPMELGAIVNDPSVDRNYNGRRGLIAGKELLDEKFTYAEFRKSLGASYPFTHAATHFVFIPGTKAEGLNSYLVMGNGEKLTLAQVKSSDNIFAGVELLTLSACDTGYGGKTADGREIEGLGVLAQRKGARAIMATLWPVDDESTRDLMVGFYGDYLRPEMNKAEALRQAQLALLGEPDKAAGAKPTRAVNAASKRFAHPYFWSPFILIGNWR